MKKVSMVWIILIQWALAFEWLHSGLPKWTQPDFMAAISKILSGFADKTPYHAYANFLQSTVIPNADLFGNLTRTGEMAVGLAFALGGLIYLLKKRLDSWVVLVMILASIGAALMSLNFYLAAGWSSPSTSGLNMLMTIIEIILAIFYIRSRNELN